MKKQIKTTEAIFPMPVLLISTFNEDGTVDVMNAAWGTMLESDMVDIDSVEAIAFDPYTNGYYRVGNRVGDAFKDGLKLK